MRSSRLPIEAAWRPVDAVLAVPALLRRCALVPRSARHAIKRSLFELPAVPEVSENDWRSQSLRVVARSTSSLTWCLLTFRVVTVAPCDIRLTCATGGARGRSVRLRWELARV
ncbi:hypothetical protein GCM10010174_51770 [Kutzneria viridogrisea]